MAASSHYYELGPERRSNQPRTQLPVPPSPQPDARRMEDASWCTCARCVVMPTAGECLCCRELTIETDSVRAEFTAGPQCITEMDGFTNVCLKPDVLRSAAVLLHDQQGSHLVEPIPNRAYRLCAYRMFTSWVHGHLGAHSRRVIPACAVSKIREMFPEDNAVYTGYMQSTVWPW
jgi:hypothetical protein